MAGRRGVSEWFRKCLSKCLSCPDRLCSPSFLLPDPHSKNINKDPRLAEACKEDSDKFCNNIFAQDGGVASCLASVKKDLTGKCRAQLDRVLRDKAYDYRYDPMLYTACKDDAKTVCGDTEPGQGRVIACMREKRFQLSWDCQAQVFRQEKETEGDIRASVRLFHACQADKNKFCKDVDPGNNQAKECLEDNRDKEGFSKECRVEIEKLMERRARDFRLEGGVMNECGDDMLEKCGVSVDELTRKSTPEELAATQKSVVRCLQDFREELRFHCRAEVSKLMKRASSDIRFDTGLADACAKDRAELCPNVQAGSARVIRCLEDQRTKLSGECAAALFDFEVHMAESIDFNYPMKSACTGEINRFCKDVQSGHSRVKRCLEDSMEKEGFGSECAKEIERERQLEGNDYRLNYKLKTSCEDDIDRLCGQVCNPFQSTACGGRVLRCLTDKRAEIEADECKNEVFYFLKMSSNDYRNDVLLAEACRGDAEQFCSRVRPGKGRVHRCLRDHHDQLSEQCRVEEERMSIIESEDVRLRPQLMTSCSEELTTFCKDVEFGNGRKFKCLQNNMGKAEFGRSCREEIQRRADLMSSDYRYDASLAGECKADIDKYCAVEKDMPHGRAFVLRCLVRAEHDGNLGDDCGAEVSRSVRMALWSWHEGQSLTASCDENIRKYCDLDSVQKVSRFGIGKVGRCLAREVAIASPLDPECRMLVLAATPDAVKESLLSQGDPSNSYLSAAQDYITMSSLVNKSGRGVSVVTISGWFAIAAMFSMSFVVLFMLFSAYKRYQYGLVSSAMTVVVKGDHRVKDGDL